MKVVLTRPRSSVLFDENRRSVRTQIVVTHRALLVLLGDVNLFLLLLLAHLLFLFLVRCRRRRVWCYRGRVMVGHQIFVRLRLRDVLREAHARHDDDDARKDETDRQRSENTEFFRSRVSIISSSSIGDRDLKKQRVVYVLLVLVLLFLVLLLLNSEANGLRVRS